MPAVPLKLRYFYRHSSGSNNPCAFTQPHGKGLLTIWRFLPSSSGDYRCFRSPRLWLAPTATSLKRVVPQHSPSSLLMGYILAQFIAYVNQHNSEQHEHSLFQLLRFMYICMSVYFFLQIHTNVGNNKPHIKNPRPTGAYISDHKPSCGIPKGRSLLWQGVKGDSVPLASPYSLLRWILPDTVLGSSSRNTTMRGYL